MYTKKIILLLILTFLAIPFVFGQDLACQYKDNQSYQVEELRYYLGDKYLMDGKPEIVEISRTLDDDGGIFKVYNPFSVKVNVSIDYTIYIAGISPKLKTVNSEIAPEQYTKIDVLLGDSQIKNAEIKEVISPILESKLEKVTKQKEICKLCSGSICLDDGASCSKNIECGSGLCVRGLCSGSKVCYNNDCKCSEKEVQCADNSKCVKKNSLNVGSRPICSFEECKTKYINATTGLCSKSAEQVEKDRTFWVIAIIVIVGVSGFTGLLLYLKFKTKNSLAETELIAKKMEAKKIKLIAVETEIKLMEETRKREKEAPKNLKKIEDDLKHKKLELEELTKKAKILENVKDKEKEGIKRLQKINDDIDAKKLEIAKTNERFIETERIKNKEKESIDELKKLKLETEGLAKKIEEDTKKITAPHPDPQANNKLVVINPYLGGYKCFYDEKLDLKDYPTSKLLHIWVWKKANGRKPRPGYHIHHKDGNKYNNDSSNLEEIEGEKHYKLHANNNLFF